MDKHFIYIIYPYIYIRGGPKMMVPKNHWFSYSNDHFGVFWGYHPHLRKHPSYIHIYPGHRDICKQELIIFLYLYDFDGISRLILFQLGMSSSQYGFYTSHSWQFLRLAVLGEHGSAQAGSLRLVEVCSPNHLVDLNSTNCKST